MSNRYFKRAAIGSGTFGEAWLVTSHCSGRDYVIKEIKVNDMTEEEFNRVKSEVATLARCKHANIIRYKESFTKQDPFTLCLVMEYADGGDLYGKVKEAKLQSRLIREDYVMHWFIQIVFAVQYLHSNNILHRDLKTQNIFLTQTNMVKVGDFGIARFVQNKQDLATTAIGTPYYLSPEICMRKPYNFKSDMWAVGCILYELCSLRHPFEAENFESLMLIILKGNYASISFYYSNVVHKLVQVLLRSNPDNRPSADLLLTAPALKDLVQNYMKFHDELINSSLDRVNPSPSATSETISTTSTAIVRAFEGIAAAAQLTPVGSPAELESVEQDARCNGNSMVADYRMVNNGQARSSESSGSDHNPTTNDVESGGSSSEMSMDNGSSSTSPTTAGGSSSSGNTKTTSSSSSNSDDISSISRSDSNESMGSLPNQRHHSGTQTSLLSASSNEFLELVSQTAISCARSCLIDDDVFVGVRNDKRSEEPTASLCRTFVVNNQAS